MAQSQTTLLLDNGAYSIKSAYLTDTKPRIFPNGIFKTKADRKRVYISDELEDCQDRSSLFYVLPFERGYLVHWDIQLQVWNRLFEKGRLDVDFQNCRLVLTDPNEIARAFHDNTEEIIFENYLFDSLLKTSAPSCVAQAHCSTENPACIVIDSGHSFTHIVPFVQGQIVRDGVIRIDMGGKALTNQLKDWISYRQLNVMDETYVINCCKEDACFVSTDFRKDMENWRAKRVEYILPDFVQLMRGQVRQYGIKQQYVPGQSLLGPTSATVPIPTDTQKLALGVERFALPELLFHPCDADINQMGLVEAVHTSINRLSKELQLLMSRNVVLTGGNSLFPDYRDRIEMDLRSMVDDLFQVKVHLPTDPIAHPLECAQKVLIDPMADQWKFADKFVTRAEYEEHGVGICRQRFSNYWLHEGGKKHSIESKTTITTKRVSTTIA